MENIIVICAQLLPVLGVVVLILLMVLLYEVIKIVKRVNTTLDKAHLTIDLYDEPISLFEEDFEEPYVDETVFNEEVEPLSEYENTKTVKKESEDIEDLIDDTFEFDTLDKKKKD